MDQSGVPIPSFSRCSLDLEEVGDVVRFYCVSHCVLEGLRTNNDAVCDPRPRKRAINEPLRG